MTICRCGHDEAQHGLYPPHECFIQRRDRGPECGCKKFRGEILWSKILERIATHDRECANLQGCCNVASDIRAMIRAGS